MFEQHQLVHALKDKNHQSEVFQLSGLDFFIPKFNGPNLFWIFCL